MNFLIIDGTQDKINFFSKFNNNSYHKTIKPSKNNNEIAVAKALSITNNLDLYGFNSRDMDKKSYENIVNLYQKGELTKNLIKPIYSS